jgi:hypothetical protein
VKERRRKTIHIILVFVLGFSLLLNLWGIEWGLPALWYPDEPETLEDIVLHMTHTHNPNPHIFNKPSLYYYFLSAVLSPYLVYHKAVQAGGGSYDDFLSSVALIARIASALIGVLGVYIAFRLGEKMSGPVFGLGAGLLAAANLGYAAYSHFAYMDIPMLVLLLLACLYAASYLESFRVRDLYIFSVFAGLAVSTKYNALLPAGIMWLVCHSARTAAASRHGLQASAKRLSFFSGPFWISSLIIFFVFLAGSPYILLDFPTFLSFLKKQMAVSQGYKVFEEHQAWFKNVLLLKEGFGLVPFLIVGAGWLFGLHLCFKKGSWKILLLYGVAAVYLIYISTWRIVAFRYVLPAIPFIIVSAVHAFSSLRGRWGRMGMLLIGTTFIASVFHAAGGVSQFKRDTRLLAEQWMENHIAMGSRVETYAYKMYLPKFPKDVQVYRVASDYVSELQSSKIHDPDLSSKDAFTLPSLRQRNPDYLVLSSFFEERFLPPPGKTTTVYPELSEYFGSVFGEKAGYKIVAKFERNELQAFYLNPTILILSRSGSKADSWGVFDY